MLNQLMRPALNCVNLLDKYHFRLLVDLAEEVKKVEMQQRQIRVENVKKKLALIFWILIKRFFNYNKFIKFLVELDSAGIF